MKIVVIGYGRVGSRTVTALLDRGHEITVVDKEAGRLGRASQYEGIELVQGNGIDVDVQRDGGMGDADLLLAVTRDDNVNLMAAQVARTHFHVPRAIARIYEPSHAEATQEDPQLTIICPTLSGVQMIVDSVDKPANADHQPSASPPPVRPRPRYDTDEQSPYTLLAGRPKVVIHPPRSLSATRPT